MMAPVLAAVVLLPKTRTMMFFIAVFVFGLLSQATEHHPRVCTDAQKRVKESRVRYDNEAMPFEARPRYSHVGGEIWVVGRMKRHPYYFRTQTK